MTVGERIKKRRTELGLSQNDLAKKMGVSKQAISKCELHDDNITTTKVSKFADALDVTESYLMGWDDDDKIERQLSGIVASEDVRILTMYTKLEESDKKIIRDMMYALLLKKG